ncbi:SCO3242 family prenyltransferase [Actinoplanes sp. NPDC051859]|uniref:SCO3242 family prenyltransferase n=1 Tax=Actinoplanes sp. NPDC051859 TaxID=3363909 RepID=UPI00379C446A
MKAPLRTLAELVRAPAALSVPGDVIAGAAAAGTLGRRSAGLAAASVCLYWAGMAANDWADKDLDAVERPERPIPSGRVSPPVALGVAGWLTAAGLVLAGRAGGPRALAVAVPLAAAVWTYDLQLKNTAAGPLGMAACRALDVLLGASAGDPVRALPAAATIAAHTFALTVTSRHEVAGCPNAWQPALALATTTAVTGTTSLSGGPVAAVLAGRYAATYGRAQSVLLRDARPSRVRAAVGAGITALPTLQGALTARAGNPLVGLVVAAAAPLGRLLARRVSPT